MKQKIYYFIILLGLTLIPYYGFAQEVKNISGTVKDSKGEPLVGANIVIKGTTTGTITDLDGKYTLESPSSFSQVLVSSIGSVTKEINVGGRSIIDVTLEDDITTLGESVVIGYGVIKKGDVTSAVSSVRSDDFIKGAVRNPTQLIQGKIAGLTVNTPSGDPTKGTEIILRGVGTLLSGASPLVLIDGVPGDMNSVAPEDIEGIDVLKDGSAAAIYGTRGTNGVIIITTKQVRGKTKPSLFYSGKVSLQTIANKLDFLSADQYRSFLKGTSGYEDFGYDTDWIEEVTRTPVSHEHNLSLKAGLENASVIANINFWDNKGIFLRTGTNDFKTRIEGMYKILNDRLTFNLSVINSQREYWPGFDDEIYRQAIMRNPTDRPKDDNGEWVDRPDVYWYYNPLQSIYETEGEYKQNYSQLNGSANLNVTKGLDFKILLSKNTNSNTSSKYETSKHKTTIRDNKNGNASRSFSKTVSDLMELTINYKASANKHNFTLLGGYSYQKHMYETFSANNYGFATDSYLYNNLAAGSALKLGMATMGSSKNLSKLIGFFSRVTYNFNEKYLLMASLRYEGSSKFGKDHKWGMFPSLSAGWRINEESFLKDVKGINNLKIRAGYGVTGIDVTDPYQSLASLNYNTNSQIWTPGGWVAELTPRRNPNPNLRWERKEETNIGVDFGFVNNRIFGSIDIYQRKTTDALWDYDVPVPPYIYSKMIANVGVLKNNGIEVSLGFIPVSTKDLKWNTVLNYSTNTNKLVSLSNEEFKTKSNFVDRGDTGEPIQTTTHRMEVGGVVGNFFGYKVVDMDDEGIWVVEKPNGEHISYKNAKADDKQILGNGLPKHYLSWNNTFVYRNFDLEVNLRGAFGFQLLNFPRMYYENPKLAQYNRLISAMDPVFGKNIRLNNDLAFVSYYIEDGDYLKIDNISLGYNFNVKNIKQINNIRLFLSCTNLLTLTKYKGIDPEVSSIGLTPGNDYRDKYPTTRILTLGLNVAF